MTVFPHYSSVPGGIWLGSIKIVELFLELRGASSAQGRAKEGSTWFTLDLEELVGFLLVGNVNHNI